MKSTPISPRQREHHPVRTVSTESRVGGLPQTGIVYVRKDGDGDRLIFISLFTYSGIIAPDYHN